jgi:hypothetical protein
LRDFFYFYFYIINLVAHHLLICRYHFTARVVLSHAFSSILRELRRAAIPLVTAEAPSLSSVALSVTLRSLTAIALDPSHGLFCRSTHTVLIDANFLPRGLPCACRPTPRPAVRQLHPLVFLACRPTPCPAVHQILLLW